MFNKLFKKKETVKNIFSPATGELLAIENVADPVFSSKAMGNGFAVEPINGEIFSPINGTVMSIFPTKHAIGLVDEAGNEVLVHMGIDTVDLKGAGFDVLVEDGQAVTSDTKLANMDLPTIKDAGKATTVMIIFTNLGEKSIEISAGNFNAKDAVGKI